MRGRGGSVVCVRIGTIRAGRDGSGGQPGCATRATAPLNNRPDCICSEGNLLIRFVKGIDASQPALILTTSLPTQKR